MGCAWLRLGAAVKDRWIPTITVRLYKTYAPFGFNFRIEPSESSADGVHGRIRQELDQVRRIRLMLGDYSPASFIGVFKP